MAGGQYTITGPSGRPGRNGYLGGDDANPFLPTSVVLLLLTFQNALLHCAYAKLSSLSFNHAAAAGGFARLAPLAGLWSA